MMALAARMKLEGNLVPRALAACPRPQEEQHCGVWQLARINGGSGVTCAAAAATSQPARSSWAVPRKASPRDGQRAGDVSGQDRERDGHPDIIGREYWGAQVTFGD